MEIFHGIPQGSTLGPLLFLIFINDLSNISSLLNCVFFADDSNFFLSHSDRFTLYSLANEMLLNLYKYCSANKLIINYEKCCYIEFNQDQSDTNAYMLSILNYTLSKIDKCKFLGVYINNKLDWRDHINHVRSLVAKSTGAITSIKAFVPQKILRKIYFALVQPYLTYCIQIWGSCQTSTEFNKLFLMQKKCIRIITNKTLKIDHHFQ